MIHEGNEGGDDKYYANDDELKILIPNLKIYFSLPERSVERKNIVKKTLQLIYPKNPRHWNLKKVRIWFRNNKKAYTSTDPERIPTAQLPPIPAADPNLPFQNVKNSTESTLPPASFTFRINFAEVSRQNSTELLDEIPSLPVLDEDWNMDQNSYQSAEYNHYSCLSQIRDKIRSISNLPEKARINLLERLENRFGECIKQMQEKMQIENILSLDTNCKRIEAPITKTLKRFVSESTSANAGGQRSFAQAQMESISAHTYRLKSITIPTGVPHLYRILFTNHPNETQEDITDIQTSCFGPNGELAYVTFDPDAHRNILVCNSKSVFLDSFTKATSMIMNDKIIAVAADCRVHVYKTENLEKIGLLFACVRPILNSCLAFWDHFIALGANKSITLWDIENISSERAAKGTLRTSSMEKVTQEKLDLESIDWSRGLVGSVALPDASVSSVDCMAAKDSLLFVGSTSHHSAHAMPTPPSSGVVKRLVGHTSGISSLLRLKNGNILSGSMDWTAREWDPETGVPKLQYLRHTSAVTALAEAEIDNRRIIVTGSEGMIKVWDPTGTVQIFEVLVPGYNVLSVGFSSEKLELCAVLHNLKAVLAPGLPKKTSILRVSFT